MLNEKQVLVQNAYHKGYLDGKSVKGGELTSGMTYPDPVLNEAYDCGVNVGEAIYFMEQQGFRYRLVYVE